MTRMIDEDRLLAYLADYKTRLEELALATQLEDTHARIQGGVRVVEHLQGQIPSLRHVVPQTPMDEIKAPAKNLVRHRNRGGSMEAALSQLPEKRQRMYRLIYDLLLEAGPLTDHEIRHKFEMGGIAHSYSGVSARRVELERAGWVVDTGMKRETENGKKATVWRAVENDD